MKCIEPQKSVEQFFILLYYTQSFIGNIILPTNSYFNVQLLIKSTQLFLDDDNDDVKIVLQKSIIDIVRSEDVAEFLVVYVILS